MLDNGGTLYIDEGKPMPGAHRCDRAQSARDRADVYFNVPKGFKMLLPYLADRRCARRFSAG